MRDEVGVLSLHTAYANRFFPGTSVQQSRLRYTLFVPWQIQLLLQQGDAFRPGQARAALEAAELALAKRLPDTNGDGTIGRRTAKLGKPVAIPPSESYWVALKAWGILSGGLFGITAARSELFSRWSSWPKSLRPRFGERDSDNNPVHPPVLLFNAHLPEPPKSFLGSGPLDFNLGSEERAFLRRRLLDTRRAMDGKPSFLANLVQNDAMPGKGSRPWSGALIKLADPLDRAALDRARSAASLSAVARAVYNAMVEALQESLDGGSPSDKHRARLQEIVAEHGALAMRLDLSGLALDGVPLGEFTDLLEDLQAWLKTDGRNPLAKGLHESLSRWELRRKGVRRSRLSHTMAARQARDLWVGDDVVPAVPIEYRWNLIRRFLLDLEG